MSKIAAENRVRTVLLFGIQTILALLMNQIFDLMVWPYLAIAPMMLLVAEVARRFGEWGRVVASIVSLVVVVGLCSMWAAGPFIVLPNGDGVLQLLSTEWPSPVTYRTIATVGLVLAITDIVSDWLVLRRDMHLVPLAPVLATAIGAVGLSAPAGPEWTLWIGGAVLALLFALVHPSTTLRTRASTLASERTLFASVAIGAIAVVIGFSSAPVGNRSDPRRLDEPNTSVPLIDPMESVVAMRNSDPPIDLFRVSNQSTLEAANTPTHWRTTALSVYDGQRWLPDSALRPIGHRLSNPPEDTQPVRAPVSFQVETLTSRLKVLPFPGQPITVDAPVNTDVDRVIVQLRESPTPGDVIEAAALIQPNRADVENRRVATRQVDDLAGSFSQVASDMAGSGNGIEQLDNIESEMRDEWALDPNQPGSGQQFALLERFLRDTNRGTEEQFATGFVLLARSLGFDARVATGFVIPPESAAEVVPLNTSQAAAWPEVNIEGLGWIRFDPVPATESDEPSGDEPKQQAQSPAIPQPPVAPPVEQATRTTEPPPPQEIGAGRFAEIGRAIVRVLTYSAAILLPVLLVVGGVIGWKAMRRRRRLRHTSPARRIQAAWANTTDAFVDAGLTIRKAETNQTIAETARPLAPTSPQEISQLAEWSTHVEFGGFDPPPSIADHAVEMSDEVRAAIADNMTLWQRLRWSLSLRSLRRATRSPVV